MRRLRQETLTEKAYRYRGVIFVISVPLLLIIFVLLTMPRNAVDPSSLGRDIFEQTTSGKFIQAAESKKYAIVFDAGSSGSRVHVFCFGRNLKLLPIGDGLELFKQTKPGLSSYSSKPSEGADSLKLLLDQALKVVPENLRSKTPVRVGATAGLRTLPGESANDLLQAVRSLLTKSPLKFLPKWVSILDGVQEGAYEWVTVNYLLGNIGKEYSETVGIVDLGGGSVQMAYAISEKESRMAPKSIQGEDSYVKDLHLLGTTYHLYVHSYLHYGLLAARAEILKLVQDESSCPCVAKGFQGDYHYGSSQYKALAADSGPDLKKCQKLALKALNKKHVCDHLKCTFGGVWNGGGGDGQKKLFVASFFFDRAVEAGIIDNPEASEAKVKPSDFEKAAKEVCATSYSNMGESYPSVGKDNQAYFCLDLVYEYVLLVKGFDINPNQEMTLVKKIKYKTSFVEAAWSLGSAIELIS